MTDSAVVITFSATSTTDTAALEILRRVRLFADEMRQAGLSVTVDGSLTVTVRPPARSHKAKAQQADDDDAPTILPSRSELA